MTADLRVLSGRYRVDSLIGRGGMATVYRGYDETLGRTVAIKILARDLARDSTFRTRFRLEAQAASRMSNPAIVRVFDAGEDIETDSDGSSDPVPFIVMELVDGRLLKDIISDGPVSVADAVRYTDGILEALEYSHRAGVIHRDIKPGNVMVTPTGQVKVMDFGIARAVSDSSATVAETTSILGTAAYLSPEQAKGEAVDARADVYSAGVVLYELLTGRPPFRGDTPVAVAYQHVSETPTPPSEVIETIPRGLDAIVLRALAKDPAARFQDATTFRAELDATASGKEPTRRTVAHLTNDLYGDDTRGAAETARSLQQLTADTSVRRTQSGPPVAWIWGGVVLVAVLVVAVLLWIMNLNPAMNEPPSTSRIVPDVINDPWELAIQKLLDADLEPNQFTESSADVPEGDVIRTEPGAGISVNPGQTIDVYVSTGHEVTTVPALVNLTRDEATAELERAGLVLGTVTSQNGPNVAAGVVLSATVDAGTEIPVGTRVNLVVASGVVVIGDMSGWTLTAAERELASERLQLDVSVIEDTSCVGTAEPTVISQSLAPGEVPNDATIELTICTGIPES